MDSAVHDDVIFRELEQADLVEAQALSHEAGWPHRVEDWRLVHQIGHGYAAVERGHVVGTGLWWAYGERFSTLGMILVSPRLQGRAIGLRLMQALIDAAGERAILLNATTAGLRLYEKTGFRPIGAIHQHQGAAFAVPVAPLGRGERIRPISAADYDRLVALDTAASGMPRGKMIAALLQVASGVALDCEGEAIGFALFRRFGRGYVIGPVIAPDEDRAKILINHWMGTHSGMFIRVDVPDDSGLSGWLEECGLPRVGGVTTMVRGEAPLREGSCRIFALVNQALG
jgi:GNAT superfamily N-acetyltransferase